MKKKTAKDQRDGLISGSALGRVIECPGSYQLGKIYDAPPPKDFTLAGTRIANLIHLLGTGADIPTETDEEELETAKFLLAKKGKKFVEICEAHDYDPDEFVMIHEKRMWYMHEAKPLFSGQVDTGAYHREKPIGIVIDDKSGWMEQPPPWQNWQLKSYALLLVTSVDHLAVSPDTIIHAATNSRFWDLSTNFGKEELNQANALITSILPRAYTQPAFATGLIPGEHCRYCPARKQCPVLSHGIAKFKGDYGPPAIDTKAKALAMTNAQLEDALETAEVLMFAINALKDEATERAKADPDAFENYEYSSGPPRRNVPDMMAAFPVLQQEFGITDQEFLSCLRTDALGAGKTSKLEKLIYSKLNLTEKATHADADEKMVETLEGADALIWKEPAPSLKKRRKKIEQKEDTP